MRKCRSSLDVPLFFIFFFLHHTTSTPCSFDEIQLKKNGKGTAHGRSFYFGNLNTDNKCSKSFSSTEPRKVRERLTL